MTQAEILAKMARELTDEAIRLYGGDAKRIDAFLAGAEFGSDLLAKYFKQLTRNGWS